MAKNLTRRDFVKGAALGLVGANMLGSSSLAVAESADSMKEKVAALLNGNKKVEPNGSPMNILVLNGSPHPDGNTVAMINAFKEGAAEAGHTVNVVAAYEKKVTACLGCGYCMGEGKGKCVQSDEFDEIRALADQADMLVLATPVHYLNISGPLQVVKSRFYAYWCQPASIKKIALFLSSNIDNYYDGIYFQHLSMCYDMLRLEPMGIYTSYGEQNKSEEKLEELRSFGRSL